MKKIVTIVFVIAVLISASYKIFQLFLGDEAGFLYLSAHEYSNGATIEESNRLQVNVWHYYPGLNDDAEFFINLNFRSEQPERSFNVNKIAVTKTFGKESLTVDIKQVFCGLDPIVRNSQSSYEIREKLFNERMELMKKGNYAMAEEKRLMVRMNTLADCRFKGIKYPFELVATLNVKGKNQKLGYYSLGKSNAVVFEAKTNQQ